MPHTGEKTQMPHEREGREWRASTAICKKETGHTISDDDLGTASVGYGSEVDWLSQVSHLASSAERRK